MIRLEIHDDRDGFKMILTIHGESFTLPYEGGQVTSKDGIRWMVTSVSEGHEVLQLVPVPVILVESRKDA